MANQDYSFSDENSFEVQVFIDNPISVNVPVDLTEEEEKAYIKAHLIQKLKVLIKEDKVVFNYSSAEAEY
jgi:hypothetical protein